MSAASEARRGIDPKHAGISFSIVGIGVWSLGAEIEAVASSQLIAAIIHRQFDLAFEHVAKFFAFMLNDTFASTSRLDVVDVISLFSCLHQTVKKARK